ncbi:MAG: HAD family hydrolase [Gammaproteobacteria bacterium]|nr:HAD family hydrolase [Gammaproteobacteria bacterium]
MDSPRKAAFLDRDGVINVDHGYVSTWEAFEFLPGAERAMQSLHRAGYQLVIVSNQSGIGRGFYNEGDLLVLNRYLATHMRNEFDTPVTGFYHCPHHPTEAIGPLRTACDCRKPAPGMILQAAQELDVLLSESLLVGDKASDILAGDAAGVGRLFKVGELSNELEGIENAEGVPALRDVPARLMSRAD